MERVCTKRMKQVIPLWLEYYDAPGLTPELRGKLIEMSASTLERMLKRIRKSVKGLSTTRPGDFIKSKISIKLSGESAKGPGSHSSSRSLKYGKIEKTIEHGDPLTASAFRGNQVESF